MAFNLGKKIIVSLAVALVTMLSACNRHSAEYKELEKNGKVHDAQIVAIDSVKGECTYRFSIRNKSGEPKSYEGKCKQRDSAAFVLDQLILIVYLDRNPSINRRLSDNLQK